ncbi:uncharacterized protein LOC104901485 [Beta vulgaris subsp. vulgaris]|uniref:uncharacterized protein LOC104901485 n=1 Tax=Beta vulgaris subsp. vulgaris TaxID=3555 RepID=UPI00053FFB09|nr:uncharacterized protein LOC104901485 [Beta vulgaris subsp. vulgaris]
MAPPKNTRFKPQQSVHAQRSVQTQRTIAQNSEVSANKENGGNTNGRGNANGGNVDNIDPLFIAMFDSPTASLVTSIFTGSNFARWSRNKWKRADYMVMSWILSYMNSELADAFGYMENSMELWSELQERFGQSKGPLIYQLKKEIDGLKQENMTIDAYYGKITRLWDELQSLKMMLVCSCGALYLQFLEEITRS